ncbi:MAG: peptide ABC transporter substrate-binding protein [Dehalococcoidia bacterium]|nr:peptide ABC transporter substrate-binding protein [Dehalococcoidia bacterium]
MSNRTLTLMMGFVAFLILVVGVILIVVVASGGGDDNGGTTQADSSSGSAKTKTTASSSSASGICAGNTLYVPGNDPNSLLDPIQVVDVGTSEYVVEIFGGLVTLGLDLKVQPDIAKRWDVAQDGTTYTFHLRDDVVFHNGKRVTARDFKYSLERAADPTNASPTVKAYLGDVVGIRDRFDGKAASVSGVKDVDDRTLQLTLIDPSDFFLAELTYPVAFVVDKDQVEKDPRNWTRKPNGTGPFKLAEFSPTEKIRLVKNDRYHLGAPKLDEIDFQLSGGSIVTQYQNNELHVGFVPGVDLEAVKSGSSPVSKDYHPQPNMATLYINLNPKKPPFDDPKVRQAFAMSIDRENINTVLLYGTQRVATSFLPPEMPGHSDNVTGYSYDPDRAKQLIKESKYATNMPRVVLNYGGSAGNDPQLLQAIQKGWQDILGVQVDLQAIDTTAFLREQRKGNFQMLSDGWSADYPDPEDFLGKLFASDSTLNYTGYKNDDVDALLQQARRETDRTTRFTLYNQAEKKILDDAVVIPTFWPVDHLLVKPCVKNFPTVSMTVPKYRYVEIKP